MSCPSSGASPLSDLVDAVQAGIESSYPESVLCCAPEGQAELPGCRPVYAKVILLILAGAWLLQRASTTVIIRASTRSLSLSSSANKRFINRIA